MTDQEKAYEAAVKAGVALRRKLEKAKFNSESHATIKRLEDNITRAATVREGLYKALKGSVKGMLSPAALAESVAGSAVAEARKRQWKTDTRPEDIASKRSAGKMKPVKRKA